MRDVKWELRKPDEWFQQDGTYVMNSEEMLVDLASCLQQSVCFKAAGHRHGSGLDDEKGTR